jgi:RNA polymerase sigma factor
MVISAKLDSQIREKLLKQHEFYILKCASRSCHRFITKSDDEWSISLLAFSQAIDSYELEKGSFLKFADLVIKRRLIDYSKSQQKYSVETSVDPITFDTEPEEDTDDLSMRMAVAEKVSHQDNGNLKLEIEEASNLFKAYGFTFFDLSECSPRAEKTRRSCAKAINFMMQSPMLVSEMKSAKQLPLKMIEKNTDTPRKILERHRKYIIAAIEILSGEYPNLAEYMRYIREERDK